MIGYSNRTIKGFERFISPILNEVKDNDELANFFREWAVVPFFGNNEASSDSFLNFLIKLSEISSTTGSSVQRRSDFTCGGFELHKGRATGFTNFRRPASSLKESYVEFCLEFIDRITGNEGIAYLQDAAENVNNNLDVVGNGYFEVVLSKVAGEPFAKINYYDATELRYLVSERNDPKRLLVSPCFEWWYMVKNRPSVVPVYPLIEEVEGVQRTIIPIKHNWIGRYWYGLNTSISSVYYQYLEWQNADYLTKETNSRFTGKILFDYEVHQDDTDEDLDEFEANFDKTFTVKGLARTYVLSGRPSGSDPVSVTQFKANTNEKFHETLQRISEDKIIASFNWYTRLLYDRHSGLGGDELKSIFKMASQTVKPRQNKIALALNKAIQLCAKHLGEKAMEQYVLQFPSLYKLHFQDELEADKEV